jgi:hypothetical protein
MTIVSWTRSVGDVARPARQPAGGPAPQARQVTLEQFGERLLVVRSGAIEQVARGIGQGAGVGRRLHGPEASMIARAVRYRRVVRFPVPKPRFDLPPGSSGGRLSPRCCELEDP